MRPIKVGDTVEVIYDDKGDTQYIGKRLKVKSIKATDYYKYHLEGTPARMHFAENEVKLVKENNMSTKYYRLIKETATLEEGSIVSNEGDERAYKPIDSVFYKDIDGVDTDKLPGITAVVVEHASDWYERVYPIGKLKEKAFGTKIQAQAAAAALYQGDKKAK